MAEVNQYPDTSYRALSQALSAYTGKDLERFVVTNGADEGLDIITKVLLDPGDEVVVPTPTYSMYRITSQIMGAKIRAVHKEEGFQPRPGRNTRCGRQDGRRLFSCATPTTRRGTSARRRRSRRSPRRAAWSLPSMRPTLSTAARSAIDITDRLDNVVVCRTLSKAFSLAGARLGYIVAKRDTVDKLNLVRPPNSLRSSR